MLRAAWLGIGSLAIRLSHCTNRHALRGKVDLRRGAPTRMQLDVFGQESMGFAPSPSLEHSDDAARLVSSQITDCRLKSALGHVLIVRNKTFATAGPPTHGRRSFDRIFENGIIKKPRKTL